VVESLEAHCLSVLRAMLKGRVTPLFGAGANLAGRPQGVRWQPGSPYLPTSGELAGYLARTFGYPDADGARGDGEVDGAGAEDRERGYDLASVCQYVAVDAGAGPLYLELRDVFTANSSPPTPLHEFFARLAGLLRKPGHPPRYQLILTTNYDDALERAFRAAGEPFDVVWYVADGGERGKFWHRPHDGDPRLIPDPNTYDDLSLTDDQHTDPAGRTVILKLHGTVDRDEPKRDSFVITEDHYIEYLTRTDIDSLIPATLSERMASTHFLLLGHSMRDWNLRVILYRIWGDQRLTFRPWSIQREPSYLEKRFWERRGNVEILDVDLGEYVAALEEHLPALAEEILG
jgi:hypothetical protein